MKNKGNAEHPGKHKANTTPHEKASENKPETSVADGSKEPKDMEPAQKNAFEDGVNDGIVSTPAPAAEKSSAAAETEKDNNPAESKETEAAPETTSPADLEAKLAATKDGIVSTPAPAAEKSSAAAETEKDNNPAESKETEAVPETTSPADLEAKLAATEQLPAEQPVKKQKTMVKTIEENIVNSSKTAPKPAKAAAQAETSTPTTSIEILAQHIDRIFAERAGTCLPGLTEREVRATAGANGKVVRMDFVYSNDEKTAGHINLTEFSKKMRCPAEGEYTFGIDYHPEA